jgi:hypothetical protein
MDLLKQGAQNLESIGFVAAMPGMRDRVLGMVSGKNDDKIKALEAEVAAGKKTRQQAQAEGGMKKGGKVKAKASSASKRADGCAIRGKTRA